MPEAAGLHLAAALDGAGWHPAGWREPGARPGDLFTPGYWTDLAAEAERGLLDFITLEDALGLQAAPRYGGGQQLERADPVGVVVGDGGHQNLVGAGGALQHQEWGRP
jgi:hypothetical protein